MTHITAYCSAIGQYVAGCTCGWTGQIRSTSAVAWADKVTHEKEVNRPKLCSEPDCPVCHELKKEGY